MAVNDFNIGKDATLVLVARGVILRPTILTDFHAKQEVIKLKSRPLNSRPIHRNIPDGWSGSLGWDRGSSVLDTFFAQSEQDYWAGLDDAIIYINQTIRERDGSVSQYRFENVVLEYSDAGTWKQEEKVPVKVDWACASRRQVS